MKTIKKIVVGTDFSENANAACQYAQHLATQLDASLHIVHIFSPPLSDAEQGYYGPTNLVEALVESANERLEKMVREEMSQNKDTDLSRPIKITYKTQVGFVQSIMTELSKDTSVDLLVLGAKGEGNWVDRLFGSVADAIARDAHCPVLLVPHQAEFKNIQHIIYAASGDSSKRKAIEAVLDWAENFQSNIHFVHIETPDQPADFGKNDYLFTFKTEITHPSVPHTVETIKSETILEGIQYYAEEKAADLIVVVTKPRNFWDKLIYHSTTHDLVWHNNLPLLVMHQDDHELVPNALGTMVAHSL